MMAGAIEDLIQKSIVGKAVAESSLAAANRQIMALIGAAERAQVLEAENRILAARLHEVDEALGDAQNEITALKAIIAEDNKPLAELDEVERVAFLQKHFGHDWTRHV